MKTVEKWMYEELGAVDTDRTGVKEILQNRLPFLLKSELSGRNLVDKVKVRMADTEDVDGETPAHHYLVDSVFGLARACANNGLDAPTNLA